MARHVWPSRKAQSPQRLLRALLYPGHSRLFEAVSSSPLTSRSGFSIGFTRICRAMRRGRLRASDRGSILSALRHWTKCLHAIKLARDVAIAYIVTPQPLHKKLQLPTSYGHVMGYDSRIGLWLHRGHRGRRRRGHGRHRGSGLCGRVECRCTGNQCACEN